VARRDTGCSYALVGLLSLAKLKWLLSNEMSSTRLGKLAKDLVFEIGPLVIAAITEALRRQWSRLFASKNILILGPKGSGKSSLLLFMRLGQPYEVIDGTRRTPDPTGAAIIVDKKVHLQDKNWVKLARDVGGDPDLRLQWAELIKEIRPHGIVYMLDGTKQGELLELAVEEIFRDVLSHYTAGLGPLVALHVFLNFSDRWLTNPSCEYARTAPVESMLNIKRSTFPSLETLRLRVWATHLSPNRKDWKEAERALFHFGADLMG
jgi:hypothetical protein